MQNIKMMSLTIGLFAMIASDSALARGGHGGGGGGHSHGHSHLNLGFNLGGFYDPGFYGFGGPGFYGFGGYGFGYPFYYPPLYAYPPAIMTPSTPPVYIQQEQPQPVHPQFSYWYYCQDPEGYYPYVKNCPSGWQQVSPQPPAQ